MKGVLILAFLTSVALTCNAQKQSDYRALVGVALQNNVTTTSVSLSKNYGKHFIGVKGEADNVYQRDKTFSVGVTYAKNVYSVNQFTMSVGGDVSMNLNRYHTLCFSPNVSGWLKIAKNMQLSASLESPIYERSELFKPTNLKAGLALGITL